MQVYSVHGDCYICLLKYKLYVKSVCMISLNVPFFLKAMKILGKICFIKKKALNMLLFVHLT